MTEVILLFARGGGGGSGGGGGGGGIIVIPIIVFGIVASWWIRKQRIKKAESAQKAAVSKDPTWSDEVIEKRVREVFMQFQSDWSEFNVGNMKKYLTPYYFDHILIMLAALKQMGRRNEMLEVKLESAILFGVNDHHDDEKDMFTVEIKASAGDRLVEEHTGNMLHQTSEAFEELWHFEREGKLWMLDSISQVNRDGLVVKYDPVVDSKYIDFAQQNHYYYNADFGWLLLPLKGVLFGAASFGHSDINHHVIGLHHDIIVQFFEYIPLIRDKAKFKDHLKHFYFKRSQMASYTVAHTTLPKDYSNILVERRSFPRLFDYAPSGMTKVTLEWAQFNKMFNVFATDADKVNSLELLHPAYMEKLGDLPFDVNLEIINNDLYLYSTDSAADYQTMLGLLKDAFDEMKM